jgi:hypothetical protein
VICVIQGVMPFVLYRLSCDLCYTGLSCDLCYTGCHVIGVIQVLCDLCDTGRHAICVIQDCHVICVTQGVMLFVLYRIVM